MLLSPMLHLPGHQCQYSAALRKELNRAVASGETVLACTYLFEDQSSMLEMAVLCLSCIPSEYIKSTYIIQGQEL